MNDIEMLRRAWDREKDPRDRRNPNAKSWEFHQIGATKAAVKRFVDEGLVQVAWRNSFITKYMLTDKGKGLVGAWSVEHEPAHIPAGTILDSMSLIVGYEDIKQAIAHTIETRRPTNYMLEGPPACAKSLILEGVRSSVPDSYIAFGSRTSAAGLSDVLFEHKPGVLLIDEVDKIRNDALSVLLGLMESGEILETKSNSTRGIKLNTTVIAACNSSAKMPPEFLSRFALHVLFPPYEREEFINVSKIFLSKAENCPDDLAEMIGQMVFDYGIGDIRKVRGVWQLMNEATETEVQRVVHLMVKYHPGARKGNRRPGKSQIPLT